jgi:hypothetical protein
MEVRIDRVRNNKDKVMDNIIKQITESIEKLDFKEKVNFINNIRECIHELSPFKNEPVDFVKWVVFDDVVANDYNPNKVAPPEMELLELSIINDGYTQPIVTWENDEKGKTEVIDGFHRNRVARESKIVGKRISGYLPTVSIRKTQSGKNDRIASTIRHNRARGKHQIDAMSEIVIELKNRNWTTSRIAKQLGMDEEEVLRLCQISGLENLFSDNDFSKAWESSDQIEQYVEITDNVSDFDLSLYRIPNEGDNTRIFHTYDKWECYKAGFYANKKEGWTNEECKDEFIRVLSNPELFANILEKVTTEWKHSCEHYLTNKSMNRIAWLGQAAVCYNSGVPSSYSGAWFEMTKEQQSKANEVALHFLNQWLNKNGLETIDMDEALIIDKQVELY